VLAAQPSLSHQIKSLEHEPRWAAAAALPKGARRARSAVDLEVALRTVLWEAGWRSSRTRLSRYTEKA
jgi:hypothetical protein